MTTLFAWIGMADLNACTLDTDGELGPIGQAARWGDYSRIILLSDHPREKTRAYKSWLAPRTAGTVTTAEVKLSSPTDFGDIYENASSVVGEFVASAEPAMGPLHFHLSPGTPAMAAVWIILSKTRFPATLIESSRNGGVKIASVPFDLSAEYIPDLLRRPDEDLVRLSQGLPKEAPEFEHIIHRCAAMQRLIARARRVAPRSIPVLILGESGTGKELLARAIHRSSPRKDGPFVPVNCGALPKDLIEAELFGHEKGAFTGAHVSRAGYVERAAGGTLFLDEVGELPAYAQVKLLRTLQEGEVYRVGAHKPVTVDFRLISATNRDLVDAQATGEFREDFFHRIAVAVLRVPPLREREGDLNLLLDSLLQGINDEAKTQPGFEHKEISASARNLLLKQRWRGNIRELHNTLQRAAVWSSGELITKNDIEEALLEAPTDQGDNVLGRPLQADFRLPDVMRDVARHYIQRALDDTGGNKSRAAELVGLPSYQTLTNWMKRYGLNES